MDLIGFLHRTLGRDDRGQAIFSYAIGIAPDDNGGGWIDQPDDRVRADPFAVFPVESDV
jgi:hypothetical protein